MPYEFAQRLFDVTKIGMWVIVARNDVRPVEIDHPVLFKPKLVRADLALKALTAHWDAALESNHVELQSSRRSRASTTYLLRVP